MGTPKKMAEGGEGGGGLGIGAAVRNARPIDGKERKVGEGGGTKSWRRAVQFFFFVYFSTGSERNKEVGCEKAEPMYGTNCYNAEARMERRSGGTWQRKRNEKY